MTRRSRRFSDSDRSLQASIAAHISWANTENRAARTEAARKAAAADRFERQVDPDGVLDPQERAKRAENAKQAHMLRMTRAAAAKRAEARNADSA